MDVVFTSKKVAAIKKAAAKTVAAKVTVDLSPRHHTPTQRELHSLWVGEVNRWNGCGKNRRTPRYY